MKIIGLLLLSAICLAEGNAVRDYSEDLLGQQEFRKSAALSEYLSQFIQNNKNNLFSYVANVEEPSAALPAQMPEIEKPAEEIDGAQSSDNGSPQLPANNEIVNDNKLLSPSQYASDSSPISSSNANLIFRPRPPVQSNGGSVQIASAPAINGPSLLNSLLEPQNVSNIFEPPAAPSLQSPNSTIKLPSPPMPRPTATLNLPSPPPATPLGTSTILKLPSPPPSKPSTGTSSEVPTPPSSSTSNRPVPPKSGLESLLAQLSPEVLEQLLAYVKNSKAN